MPLMRTQTPVARRLSSLVLGGRIHFEPHKRGEQAGFRWTAGASLWGQVEGIIPIGSAAVVSLLPASWNQIVSLAQAD